MRHKAGARFWSHYEVLPPEIQKAADKAFVLLKRNPSHPSLHFKKIGKYWSARVSISYRALATKDGEDFAWFWIGTHDAYDELIK
jgi:hypothetical protein